MNHQNRINSGGTEATANARADRLTALLSAAPANTDHAAVRAYMHDLADAGCAVMLVLPGTKAPADVRTPAQRRAEDKAAQAAGMKKSKDGLDLATTDKAVLDGYLDRYIRFHSTWADAEGNEVTWNRESEDAGEITLTAPVAVNLAVETGRSRIVVADADTPAQVAAFSAAGYAGAGPESPVPTVSTPGVRDAATGEWVHSDGGHWWFTVPEDTELPDNLGALTLGGGDGPALGDGFVVLWRQRYVLIPPSTRPEGGYKTVGTVAQLPEALAEQITEAGRQRSLRGQRKADARDRDSAAMAADPAKAWGAAVTWAEILTRAGWTDTGEVYGGCGCGIWTAAGQHASPRSAIAHEGGCPAYPEPDPVLCIFTTGEITPFTAVARQGKNCRVVTRLAAIAALDYGNDEEAAMTDLWNSKYGNDAAIAKFALNAEQLAMVGIVAGAEGDDSDQGSGRGKDRQSVPTEGRALHEYLTLPDDYWNAHPVLAHIRQAARASGNSPDGVIGALHAEIAAGVHPACRLDTGLKRPTALNAYTLLCDDHGGGKTTAMEEAEDLLSVTAGWRDPMGDAAGGEDQMDRATHRPGAFGSGEGISAAYVSWLPVDLLRPKGPKHNKQVRSNVLFTVDEGESVWSEMRKPTTKFGPEFRAAWSGRRLGQVNAKEENRRAVPAGQYVIGACIGMQTPTLRDILSDREHKNGTGPRLDCYWMPDPSAPDVRPAHPGPLMLDLTGFDRVIVLCDAAKAVMEHHALQARRGEVSAESDRHRDLSIARRAGRLAIMCAAGGGEPPTGGGPFVVAEVFWRLAEIEYERSVRIKAHADTLTREARTAEAKVRIKTAAERETAVDDALRAARVGREDRIAGRITRFLAKHGPTPWGGKTGVWQRAKDRTDDRAEWERVLEGLVADADIELSGGVYSVPTDS